MLVPLSPPGAFEGGGTGFWAGGCADAPCAAPGPVPAPAAPAPGGEQECCPGEQEAGGASSGSDSGSGSGSGSDSGGWLPFDHVARAAAGTAVVFSGRVLHAGLPVTAGTRHLFVMSFNLRPRGGGGGEPTAAERAAASAREEAESKALAEDTSKAWTWARWSSSAMTSAARGMTTDCRGCNYPRTPHGSLFTRTYRVSRLLIIMFSKPLQLHPLSS